MRNDAENGENGSFGGWFGAVPRQEMAMITARLLQTKKGAARFRTAPA